MHGRIAGIAAVLAATLAGPPAAHGSGVVNVSLDRAVFRDVGSPTTDRITVAVSGAADKTYVFTDVDGDPRRACRRCAQTAVNVVTCQAPDGTGVDVNLGGAAGGGAVQETTLLDGPDWKRQDNTL